MLGSAGKDDQIGQVIAQMTTFSEGLNDIKKALDSGVKQLAGDESEDVMQTAALREVGHAVAELAKFNEKMEAIGEGIQALVKTTRRGIKENRAADQKIQVVNKIPHAFLDVLRNQFSSLANMDGAYLALGKRSTRGWKSAEGLQGNRKEL